MFLLVNFDGLRLVMFDEDVKSFHDRRDVAALVVPAHNVNRRFVGTDLTVNQIG